jgi:diguanylate cyclase (GGDEF)-like protein
MLEPMVKANYGHAFNDPMFWLIRRLRMTPPVQGPPHGPPQGPPPFGSAAPIASAAEATEPLPLVRPLHAANGNPVVLLQEPWPPGLFRELLRDLLLGLGLLAALAAVRAGVLVERRSQRLLLRRAEQAGNRRIRHAGQELERLLDRMGPGGTGPAREGAALGRLLESGGLPPGDPKQFGGLPIEAKLTWLADRFQQFLERVRSLALLDPLTQLPNRRFFIEQVQLQLEGCELRGERFAILFVDVDKFKEINDSYGHAMGDAALVLVAETLQSLTENRDFLGRYGGDEFAILHALGEAKSADDAAIKADLMAYATRLLAPFESKVDLEGIPVEISVSVGISLLDSRSSDLKTAMRRSDIAMYRAKQNPQGRVAIFDPDDEATDLDDYRLYGDLMQALRDSSFEIVFQPIVDRHGSVVAVEALARWRHPMLGLVNPEIFLDLAERYRQINAISDALLALTLQSFQPLHLERPQIRLSLNLSPSKLGDPLLLEKLDQQEFLSL